MASPPARRLFSDDTSPSLPKQISAPASTAQLQPPVVVARLVGKRYGEPVSTAPGPFEITNGRSEYTIGCDDSCDFKLSHPQISGVHARLVRGKVTGETIIIDDSTNGTFVNGVKIGKGHSYRLCDCDLVGFLNPYRLDDPPEWHCPFEFEDLRVSHLPW